MSKTQVERRTLHLLIAINTVMFLVELAAGWVGDSMGLTADALDMLADAGVYGVALLAVGSTSAGKARAAVTTGLLQLALAGFLFCEVSERWLHGSTPASTLMVGVSVVALAANATCVILLKGHRDGDVHMRASWIFSTTDVQANLGVILAGVLVSVTASPVPDLLIGLLVGLLVVRGAVRILRATRAANAAA